MKTLLASVITLVLTWASPSFAGQMSTYIQGSIIKRSKSLIVVQTKKGTYWIKAFRPPSHTRQCSALEVGFWVQTRHIQRFRPVTLDARLEKSFTKAN